MSKLLFVSLVRQAIPWAGRANYAAVNGSAGSLMHGLAQEAVGEGTRVNAVAPGAIPTDLNRLVRRPFRRSPDQGCEGSR